MAEVTQTILHDDPQGRIGNCLQAAIASALDLPLDQVPHFAEHPHWQREMANWALGHGYTVLYSPTVDGIPLGVAYGPSPRAPSHAVVVRDGVIVWDPHPPRAGILSVTGVFEFWREDP